MSQLPFLHSQTHHPPPTTTLTVTAVPLSLLPSPRTTATFLLPLAAITSDPKQHPSSSRPPATTAIPFALASMGPSLFSSLSLPTSSTRTSSTSSGRSTVAVLIELEAPGSGDDDDQPPRLLVTVDEQGNMVWPLEGEWWSWAAMGTGETGWFPGVEEFGAGGGDGMLGKGEGELR